MMNTIDGGSNCMKIVQQSVNLNLNSALYSLVTPRRTFKICKKRMSLPTPSSKGYETRYSPSRMSPSQSDGKGYYAGAKFGEVPPPTELPPPPNHWVGQDNMKESYEQCCVEITNTLKILLKVQS
ncbi:hypothetical protein CEXT_521191 [Caerostris extrusa]|uniref:Uncharacterized protein n=1 Tax=Caerostris extrusa TaxID=172846 RepID=A0AAV4XLU0_CAEEX|nr:hypothetical protein CEXT_521191 [Caerostris extrusa]